jgi:tetratricopeptide (TPR) repeat protein
MVKLLYRAPYGTKGRYAMAERLRVFVSHSHQDNDFCHQIVQALRDAGADVWYDEHNLGWGELHDEIQRELGRRAIFVLILSKAVFASKWVKRETKWAYRLYDRDPTRAIVLVTAGQIDPVDFDPEKGWLFLDDFKRIEAPGYKPYPAEEAARRLVRAFGLTPAGEAPIPVIPQPTESADDLLTRGKALKAQKKYAEAIPVFERATHLAPTSFEAWANLALALNETGCRGDDLQAYSRALALDDKQAWVWYNMGNALGGLKRYQEALAAYERALALYPNYQDALSNKGLVLGSLGRYEEALAAYDQALALNPNLAQTWNNKGTTLGILERYQEALDAVVYALSLDSNDAVRWSNKGNALGGLGRLEEALVAYEQALALDPNYAVAWSNKGLVLGSLGRYGEALTAYDQALALDSNDAYAWNNKAISLRALGRNADADEAAQRARELGFDK